jgi:glycerate dehydrogenase
VAVCNLRDYCTPSVVQHVFAVLLALTHRLADYDASPRAAAGRAPSQFSVFPYPIRELAGRRSASSATAPSGRGVAQAAAAFGLEVVVANRPGGAPSRPRRISTNCCLASTCCRCTARSRPRPAG